MTDLITRLENATGPDRELDCELYPTLVGGRLHWLSDTEMVIERPIDGMWIRSVHTKRSIPKHTADATDILKRLAVLLPNVAFSIQGNGPINHAMVANHPGKGATPAIALCAALLRALLAKDCPNAE